MVTRTRRQHGLAGRFAPLGFSVALLTAVAAPLVAQPYRWVDENGVVQFSDRPPPNVPRDQVQGPRAGTVGEEIDRRRAQEEAAEAARRAAELEAEIAAAEAEAAAADAPPPPPSRNAPIVESRWTCEEARGFQERFASAADSPTPYYTTNPDGTFKRSTPAEISALAQEWAAAAEALCAPGIVLRNPAAAAPPAGQAEEEGEAAIPQIDLSEDQLFGDAPLPDPEAEDGLSDTDADAELIDAELTDTEAAEPVDDVDLFAPVADEGEDVDDEPAEEDEASSG